ncbi:ISL3 family transposase [Longispora fulva]|uniref:ISL3 family transposase n=1 Tax=Longispora fulva TaxID=619741 RepID=UPI0018CB9EA6|nr:ISL3 family transposase [Longispora fulva]
MVRAETADCAACGGVSGRVHSRYRRRLADVAVGDRPAELWLLVRRFFCDNLACAAKTFVEQVAGLTRRRCRISELLRRTLTAIGLALAGRAGARLAAALGLRTSRNSLIRMVKALPDPPVGPVKVLGVDDFALKRGHVYGTVLIDCQTRKVIDLLPGRDATPLAEWLAGHPAPEVICRDRSGAYADGARTGAPGALQVADRFHLWQNLAVAVERCVAGHKACLADPVAAPPDGPTASDRVEPVDPTGPMAERRREHHALVHGLLARGMGIREIARYLGWGRHTVQRYARAATWQQLVVGRRRQLPSSLDPFKKFLREHWTARRGAICDLYQQVAAQGFGGSYSTVRDFLRTLTAPDQPAPPPAPPSVRRVAGWICRHPDNLPERDTLRLKTILARCPELDATFDLVRSFAAMLTGRTGSKHLTSWITTASTSGLATMTAFAKGLTLDLDAVTAGLTQPWNSGPVEGNVNRIKMLKRQMYGRAGFDLLRKRVLLA